MNDPVNRRKNERIYLGKTEVISADLRYNKTETSVLNVRIKDLSEGGLGFLVKRPELPVIKEDKYLLLENITGSRDLHFLKSSKLIVRWLLDIDGLNHISFGCEFIDLETSKRKKLKDYVSTRMVISSWSVYSDDQTIG
ncbi:MAG: PilZ domain-containing protein [Desulfobacteraceae bacterium]|nr:PilZ domain-containing protein [Desulfobacteraceae bacterium]